jgi:hypothetical protein
MGKFFCCQMLREIETQLSSFVERSAEWSRFKNILVQSRDQKEKDWIHSDAYRVARLELRSEIQRLVSKTRHSRKDIVETWIREILDRTVVDASSLKLGINRVWSPNVRWALWKTKYRKKYDRYYPNPIHFETLLYLI